MRRIATFFALLLAVPVHAQEETWAGKTVITIRHDIRIGNIIKPGNAPAGGDYTAVLDDSVDYRVLEDKDGKIKVVTTQGVVGWFDKADAVTVDRAVAHFNKVLVREPRNVSALQKRAHAWELRGEYDLALRDINELLSLAPSDPAGWISRGVVYSTLKKYDKAIDDYSLAIRYSDAGTQTLAAGYHNRGEARIGKKEYGKAIADLTTAIAIAPKLSASYNYRGLAHFLNRDYDKANQDFDKSHKLDPSNGWLYKNRAWMLATCKDAKVRSGAQAVAHAKKALALEPHPTFEFHETLAAALAESGDFREAIRRQMLAMEDPLLEDDEAARNRLDLYRQKRAYRQE